jgi:iron-sulfur cluster assembly accessory protein
MLPNVTITTAAEKFMRRMVRFSGQPEGAGFRLSVSAGGCSGYNADFTVEAAPRTGDEALVVNGLKVFLPAESRLLLEGLTIDFADTPMQSGLTIFNPSAGPCGCSTSSSAQPPGVAKVDIGSIRPAPSKVLAN